MSPLERFLARLTAIQLQIDQLPNAAVAAMVNQLDQVRRQVLGELAGVEPGSYQAFRLAELERRLDNVMAQFTERYVTAVGPTQQEIFTLGQELAARPLIDAGVTYAVPQISRRTLEVAQSFQALLISNLADDAIADISRNLRLGLLRGDSVFEVAQGIAGSLTEGSTFGTIATRAEAITRTELGRIQAIATQAGLAETQRLVPDLQKSWLHSGNTGRYARLGHMEAEGQVRDVDATYRVRPNPGQPYEELMYPRDPNASPASTIFCGCLSVPHRAEWTGAIAAAKAENAEFLRRRAA